MHVISTTPIAFVLQRDGGAIITCRLDIWKASGSGWDLIHSALYQDVTSPIEVQEIVLLPGLYTAVFVCRVEESINGIYSIKAVLNDTIVAEKAGNVDTTSQPHDVAAYKNQFILEVK